MKTDADILRIDWKATKVFYKNRDSQKSVVVNIGGAGSSKSMSIIQLMMIKFFSERGKIFLTCRKSLPALRMTAYRVATELMKEAGLYRFVEHNKSDRSFYFPGGKALWTFTSIDDPEKIKSSEFNYIHMEEANEFTYDDFMVLRLRLRARATDGNANRMYLTFNPSDEEIWIRKELVDRPGAAEVIHSTYLDNPFLSDEYIKTLLDLKEQDESYYKIYTLGEWATVKGLIYPNFLVVPSFPFAAAEEIFGLDFGFNHPSVFMGVGIRENTLMLTEHVHEAGLTNTDLLERMEAVTPDPGERKRREVYADCAEPARILEIENAGWNIWPSDKSVRDGIDFLKRYRILSLETNVKTNRDFRSYKWKTDRNGHTLDEPVKFRDDGPDATRYAAYTHLLNRDSAGGFIGQLKGDFYPPGARHEH